jgi:hypothetical protein
MHFLKSVGSKPARRSALSSFGFYFVRPDRRKATALIPERGCGQNKGENGSAKFRAIFSMCSFNPHDSWI